MRNVPGLETIQRDYASRGVKFYYIYKALAHPEKDGYVTPFTLGERLKHIAEARRTLGTKFTWLCDAMDNRAKHAMGNAPNSEFVVDPEGKVVRRRAWSDPSQLRRDLEKLVGPVDRPTRVSDLDMKTARPPQAAASGVVPRLSLPPALQAVRIVPVVEEGGLPFYVKLRAEADAGLLSGGRGQLYLGFHLDPIYGVSWNNLVAPVKFQL
ncbi:MAG: hypothetical protein OER86_05575, partial [Phycisphaerae bacterium]|nr:hypothetical protein [Phycisphaerae bacterium]